MDESKVKNFSLSWLIPPSPWKYPVIIMLAVAVGLIITIFKISNAASYMSDDPKACINCHIMTAEYASWLHGSHGRNTKCNDCHVPHDNIVREYYFHASDGLRHSFMFTFKLEPQVIKIHSAGQTVVQENCIRCHENLLNNVATAKVTVDMVKHGKGKLCWDCHREVPHGRVHSLSATPDARVPGLTPAAPDWLMKLVKKEK